MKVQILSIGTELTLGQTVDTNAAWLSQQLAEIGIACRKHVTVGDDLTAIVDALRAGARESDVVLVTGGLGPTADDLTRQALAEAMGVKLELHRPSLEWIATFFAARKRTMSLANEVQALVPAGAQPIENTCGTAPGLRARLTKAEVFVMPGVPREMREMFTRDVMPPLRGRAGGAALVQRTLHTFGGSEAEIGERIADLMDRSRNPNVGTSAAELIISIRINARGASPAEAARLAEADLTEIRGRLGTIVFGEGEDTLQHAVGRLLIVGHKTVATAESCTGGLIAKRLTDVPGASAYLMESYITYSNESKTRLLGVGPDLIAAHGAVSGEVAEAMAAGGRRASGADFCLSATGIAGPTGGSPAKPVGLVYLGLSRASGTEVRELRLGDHLTRREIRDRTAKAALNILRLALLERSASS